MAPEQIALAECRDFTNVLFQCATTRRQALPQVKLQGTV